MNPNYILAANAAQSVGKEIASLVLWLQKMAALNLKDVHVIGHSLGGQAVGAVGRYIQNPRVGRITGAHSFPLELSSRARAVLSGRSVAGVDGR